MKKERKFYNFYYSPDSLASFLVKHPLHIKWLHGSSVASRIISKQIGHWKFCANCCSYATISKG